MTSEATEAAMNQGFVIDITGDTQLTLDSSSGATVTDQVSGSPQSGETAPILNTPAVNLRTLRFTSSDGAYVFELAFSQSNMAEGDYQIGVGNVTSTIGNNINEDAAGTPQGVPAELTESSEPTASAQSQSTPANTPSATATVSATISPPSYPTTMPVRAVPSPATIRRPSGRNRVWTRVMKPSPPSSAPD